MAPTAVAVKGLGRQVYLAPAPRHIAVTRAFRIVCTARASKDVRAAPLESDTQLAQTAKAWLKTGVMAGSFFLLGLSGAAHAATRTPTREIATVAAVEQRAPGSCCGGGAVTLLPSADWQQQLAKVQSSPYTMPLVVAVLLVAGVRLLSGGGKAQDVAAPAPTPTASATPVIDEPPAQPPAPPAEPPSPPPPPAPKGVAVRPLSVSFNPNMGAASSRAAPPPPTIAAPPPMQPVMATTPVVPAETAPIQPMSVSFSPNAGTASAQETPRPPGAPMVATTPVVPADTAPIQPMSVSFSPNAGTASAQETPRPPGAPMVATTPVVPAETAPIQPMSVSFSPNAGTASAKPAPPREASSPPAPEASPRPSAKEWIAQWRAAQPPKAAAPPSPPAASSSPHEAVPSAAALRSTSVGQPALTTDQYVLYKFADTDSGAKVTSRPVSVLEPRAPAVAPSSPAAVAVAAAAAGIRSVFDSSVSDDDLDPPPPPAPKLPAATVAAATVVQGPLPPSAATPMAAASSPSSSQHSTGKPVVSASAAVGTGKGAASGRRPTSGRDVSEESLAAAARDPIVVTAALVVGAARQMRGFGTFVSDGLMPAVGALLGGGLSKPSAR